MAEIKQYPEPDGIYRHYKGGKYQVIAMAKHTETSEDLVIYQSLNFLSIHARPLSQWFEKIGANPLGTDVCRFELEK
jgi:hypothetical protein